MATKKTNKRTIKTAHRSSSELGAVSWVDALAERWERKASGAATMREERAFKFCADELRNAEAVIRGVRRMESASTTRVSDGTNYK